MISKTEIFSTLFENTNVDVGPTTFLINIIIAIILSALLSKMYVHWSSTLASRKRFAKNFVLLTMTTMFIITVVKSSLALSLGLVGALSIVRFRTAIKETEELIFLFIAISIGLGLGADQRLLTLLAFVVISITLWVRSRKSERIEENLYLTIESTQTDITASDILDIVKTSAESVDLKRFDRNKERVFLSLFLSVTDFSIVEEIQKNLTKKYSDVQISFLDSKVLQ